MSTNYRSLFTNKINIASPIKFFLLVSDPLCKYVRKQVLSIRKVIFTN